MTGILITSTFFGLGLPFSANAATTPPLGTAEPYSVLSSTYTNTTATTINGEVGFTTGPAVPPLGTHVNYGSVPPYATAGADQGIALSALASEPCTFTFAAGAVDLSIDTTHGVAGVYDPGVYCSTGAMEIGGALSLNGAGTYIFRPVGALTSTAGAVVALGGAAACDVFWTPSQAATLAANTTFAGTIIADAGITIGANTTWTGRALSFGGTITTDTDTITIPSCAAAPVPVPVPVPDPVPVVPSGPATNITVMNQYTVGTAPVTIPPGSQSQPIVALGAQSLIQTQAIPVMPLVVSLGFPDTGFPPEQKAVLGDILMLAGLVTTIVVLTIVLKVQISIR